MEAPKLVQQDQEQLAEETDQVALAPLRYLHLQAQQILAAEAEAWAGLQEPVVQAVLEHLIKAMQVEQHFMELHRSSVAVVAVAPEQLVQLVLQPQAAQVVMVLQFLLLVHLLLMQVAVVDQ